MTQLGRNGESDHPEYFCALYQMMCHLCIWEMLIRNQIFFFKALKSGILWNSFEDIFGIFVAIFDYVRLASFLVAICNVFAFLVMDAVCQSANQLIDEDFEF